MLGAIPPRTVTPLEIHQKDDGRHEDDIHILQSEVHTFWGVPPLLAQPGYPIPPSTINRREHLPIITLSQGGMLLHWLLGQNLENRQKEH